MDALQDGCEKNTVDIGYDHANRIRFVAAHASCNRAGGIPELTRGFQHAGAEFFTHVAPFVEYVGYRGDGCAGMQRDIFDRRRPACHRTSLPLLKTSK